MAEPLKAVSPNAMPRSSAGTPQSKSPSTFSPKSHEFSLLDDIAYSPISRSTTFAAVEGKHPRSANNSPQKVLKKAKYEYRDERTAPCSFDCNPSHLVRDDDDDGKEEEHGDNEDHHNNIFDDNDDDMMVGNDSGFSDLTVIGAAEMGLGRQIFNNSIERDEDGETTGDLCAMQLQRESSRPDRRKSIASSRPTTPGKNEFQSPSASSQKSATPTPRGSRIANLSMYSESPGSTPTRTPAGERTVNLIDFTQQFNNIKAYPSTPSRSHRRSQSASPEKQLVGGRGPSPSKQPLPVATPNERRFLLDFDIPPPPTPRSIPTVTPRELENMKSSYLAQIAALKAELSGKDVVIKGLKHSLNDAERRYSNGIVELRQVREENEDLSARSVLLESKLHEAGRVMNEVKEELIEGTRQLEIERQETQLAREEAEGLRTRVRERDHDLAETEDQLQATKDQMEKTKNDLENAKHSLESTKSELERTKASLKAVGENASRPNSVASSSSADVEAAVAKALDAANKQKEADINSAVERVAKELHALYKSKHEQKVGALKTSYAARWEKRVKELESRNAELSTKNNELSSQINKMEEEQEEHLTGPVVSNSDFEQQKKELEEMKAMWEDSRQELKTLKTELEVERQEKGELVSAVDELLSMGGVPGVADTGIGSLRGSISRASGIGIARGLNSPVKQADHRPTTLRGGIEKMGGGAGLGASNRFGLRG